VPPLFSESFYNGLKKAGKTVEYFTYPGADHNLSGASFNPAMERSVKFFDQYLKK
jgi:dipeptidyl aminopeptidase/acylaminoacyl peptidase